MHALVGFRPPRSPFYGETLAWCPRAVYPPRFFRTVARRWTNVFLWLWLGHINMESKGLAMPTTIFPPMESTREFAPLSLEPGHIYRWQVIPAGGPIAIASPSKEAHMHTHVR
jgi:hypothetical protein